MKRFLALGFSMLFVAALGIHEADARRMGGGGSGGTFSRQASPPAQQQRQQSQQQQSQQQTSAASRGGLMGPLMGLAAGGLLAAMFFGGAFEGIQFFDLLILLLIAGGVLLIFRSRAQQQKTEAAVPTSLGGVPGSSDEVQRTQTGFEGFDARTSTPDPEIRYGAPDWFDEQGFLLRAKQHFIDLQAAWDANDFRTLEEFVTPQLYRFLQEERARQPGEVYTDVRNLAAEVSNIQQVGSTVELAVMFHGVISESGAPEARFCETWHLIRDLSEDNAPWLIQGIEQIQ